MASTRLGINITEVDINDFFGAIAPKPQREKQKDAADLLRQGPELKTSKPKIQTGVTIHRPGYSRQLSGKSEGTKRRGSGTGRVGDGYYVIEADDYSNPDDFGLADVAEDDVFETTDSQETEAVDDGPPEPMPPDHPALDVYDNYSFDHKYDPELPITEHRERVLGTIESNQVTIIQGQTGSGKTTQVPQYILDYYYSQRKYCNILVTQPRRIAAFSIAKRVCAERGVQLGTLVGYQVARDRQVSEDTRITYMTTGVLLQKLIKYKNMNEYTHLILDEVHERDQDIDFGMLVVRKFLRTVSKHVKIILMSATVDCSLFSKYFAIPIRGQLEGAPVVSVEGKIYDVEEYYLDDLKPLCDKPGMIPSLNIAEPGIHDEMYQLAKNLIKEFDADEIRKMGAAQGSRLPANRGTVLVFLPGLPEIRRMHGFLEELKDDRNLLVLPLHSEITNQEQSRVFIKPGKCQRKIILSTNIAESSITVPDIKYVIDFCLVKSMETDRDTNYQSLRLHWAALSSLTQRKGRAGRVSEGECFRLITQDLYYRLPQFAVPEMQRRPLEQVILKVKLLELGDPCGVLKLALQPPDVSDIKRTIMTLKEVGALTVMQKGRINPLDGDLTFVGRVLGHLPVDVRIGKLLILGHVFGCLEECLVIGAALSIKSFFSRPFKKDFEAYSHKMDWAQGSFSDCIAALTAYKAWKWHKERSGFRMSEDQWGRQKFIQTRKMHEVDQLAKELGDRLKEFNLKPRRRIIPNSRYSNRLELTQNDLLILKVVICGSFYPFYFTSGEIDEVEATKTMSGHDPFSTVVLHNCPTPGLPYKAAIAAQFRQCGKGKFLHFESSRCYVEFDKVSVQENPIQAPVLPQVYLAIKMRQLGKQLNLLISKKQDEKVRRKLQELHLTRTPVSGLRTDRLTAPMEQEGKVVATDRDVVKQVELQTSGYVNVFVTSVIECGHFWAHYGTQETFQQLRILQDRINQAAEMRQLSDVTEGMIQEGLICLARYENEFYRARILEVRRTLAHQGSKEIHVFFVDYGNISTVEAPELRQCGEQFLRLPFQAFECYLSGIRPVRGEWTQEANERFNEIAQDRVLVAKIYSLLRDTLRLDLYDGDVHINHELIEESYAQASEEPYVSKMAREDAELQDRLLKESQDIIKEFEKGIAYSRMHTRDFQDPDEVIKVNLRGPFSPYELYFYSLTATGKMRATNIERDSVCSVLICEEPQDKHPRFLASANIGINSSGNTLIARDSTLMPNIHGIASLMPVLFAPYAEYRCDKQRQRYTGAICGLGYDPASGAPVMPDHDMEITFDVEFTKDDVLMINIVRNCINIAFCSEEKISEWGTSAVEKIQSSARTRVIELVYKQREDVEPTNFSKPYCWNEIPVNFKLEPPHELDEEGNTPLYTLHSGILLQEDTMRPSESQVLNKRERVRQLYPMAGRSTEAFAEEVVCPLCNVRCKHPRGLYLHLESRVHRAEEERLFRESRKSSGSIS